MKNWMLTIFLVIVFISPTNLLAQKLKADLAQDFKSKKEIYLIDNGFNSRDFTTSDGRKVNFLSLIQQAWPEKKFIEITEEGYLAKENVQQLFHITLASFSVSGDYSFSTRYGLLIQRGPTGKHPTNALYWYDIDLKGFGAGVLAERLEITITNLKQILSNYEEPGFRSNYAYRCPGINEILASSVLYVEKGMVDTRSFGKKQLSDFYPYKVAEVSKEECMSVISKKKDNSIYVDRILQGDTFTVMLYTGQGKLIMSSSPWHNPKKQLSRKFFELLYVPEKQKKSKRK